MNKKGMLANLIGAFVAILIGVSLIPLIAEQVNQVAANQNQTGELTPMTSTMLKLLPGFFALGIIGVAIAMVASALRSAGLMGGRDYSEPTEEEVKVARRKQDEEERDEQFVYKPKYKSPEYEYEDDAPSKPVMDATVYEEKKKAYDDKMKSFNQKKKLTDKDLEKNL